jgi:hypothetical protein
MENFARDYKLFAAAAFTRRPRLWCTIKGVK